MYLIKCIFPLTVIEDNILWKSESSKCAYAELYSPETNQQNTAQLLSYDTNKVLRVLMWKTKMLMPSV